MCVCMYGCLRLCVSVCVRVYVLYVRVCVAAVVCVFACNLVLVVFCVIVVGPFVQLGMHGPPTYFSESVTVRFSSSPSHGPGDVIALTMAGQHHGLTRRTLFGGLDGRYKQVQLRC